MKIRYVAPVLDNSGIAEASRNYIFALLDLGVEVSIYPLMVHNMQNKLYKGEKLERLNKLINCIPDDEIDINIVQSPPYPHNRHLNYILKGVSNVLNTVWEFPTINPKWKKTLDLYDWIFLPSSFCEDAFKKEGYRTKLIPHCFNIEDYKTDYNFRERFNISKDKFIFYSIFQWSERKNPFALLRSYFSEFKKSDNVVLVIKTWLDIENQTSYFREVIESFVRPKELEEITKSLDIFETVLNNFSYLFNDIDVFKLVKDIRQRTNIPSNELPDVLIIPENFTDNEILGLHKDGDCFVTATRTEGWGLPVSEAMLMKSDTIVPYYSGYVDYCNKDNTNFIDVALQPYHNEHGISMFREHDNSMIWSSVDEYSLMKVMRKVFKGHNGKAENGYKTITENYNYDKIGKLFVHALEDIL